MKWFTKLTMVLMALLVVFLAGCSNNEKAMVEAVTKGDTAKVQGYLDQGLSPDLKADDGKSVLMLAAYLGHTDIAKLLIDRGADVNAKDNDGKTPLMYAAEKGNIEMARLLLEKGADLNAVDNNGKTALQIAQEKNQTAMVEFLSNWGKPAPVASAVETVTPTETPESTETPNKIQEKTSTPEPSAVPVAGVNRQLASVFFDFDKTALRADQTGTLTENIAILKDNPKMEVILSGHADERGTGEYNRVLSKRRAEAIQKYLIAQGIAPERFVVYGFGKDYPVRKGHDEDSRSYNRRVDILVWDTVLTKEQVIHETIK